jgi:muramoyltetrapeptide carboxypeptidase LdcA involved in peptidoglycan recycling
LYPAPFDLGLRRLREIFNVEPVEFPTTRLLDADPAERAADLHAAFADSAIAAVITSIGGDDQLKVLRHLDAELLANHPKLFIGFSDSTNLLHYLWNLGVVAYHGGVVMVQWGRAGVMHPMTHESLHRALFTRGEYVLPEPTASTDVDKDWASPSALGDEPALQPATPWSWHGPPRRVIGPGWGGSLEIVDFHLRASRYMQPVAAYTGGVLFLESSEELPSATYVYRLLMGMGERGLLQQFPAILLGRPKTWSFECPQEPTARRVYASQQHDAALRAIAEYHPEAIVVLDVDFGHTDPQLVLPHGGQITVDAATRRITVDY